MDVQKIKSLVKGDVATDAETLRKYSKDTSIFEKMPALVVFPKDEQDVSALVKYVKGCRERGENISLTARGGGSDMSGGPLTDSIVVSFTKYMNRMGEIGADDAVAEPGGMYRDFERRTLAKNGMILPPYPASREICALGGMIANNAGGELTLTYGKMDRYVREADIVLADGSTATFRPLTVEELVNKKTEQSLEGEI